MLGNRAILILAVVSIATTSGERPALAAPDALRGGFMLAADDGLKVQTPADAIQRKRAEDLAREASERFTDILSKDKAKKADVDTSERREQAASKEAMAPVWDWLARASERYEDVIVAKLRNPSGEIAIETRPRVVAQQDAVAQAAPEAAAPVPQQEAPALSPSLSWGSVVESVREWLARANRSYRTVIVKELKAPVAPEVKPIAGAPVPAAEQKAPEMKADASAPAVAPAAPAPPEPAIEAPVRKSMAIASADAKRTARETEEKRKAEAQAKQKAAAEAKRLAEQKRKEEAEANRRAEAEAKRVAEEKRRAEAEAKRMAEVEAKRVAEEKRRAEAEAKRKVAAEAERAAEAKRKADEAKRVADAKRKADEAKQVADAEAAKRQAEADAKRLAEESEAEHKAVAEAKAKRMVAVPGNSAETSPPVRKPANGDRGAASDDAPAAPKSAAPGAPKAREETVIAEAPPPKMEKRRSSVSKIRRAKKRVHKHRRRRYAVAASAHRHVNAHRSYHKRRHVHRHRRHRPHFHRGCGKKVYGYRRRAARWGGHGNFYVVRRGDTLSGIARRHYGRSARYGRIYRANRGRIRNANLIYPGQRLYIP